MNNRIKTIIAGMGAWLFFMLLTLPVVSLAGNGLNVLFICVDDLRPTLGCYGDPVARTPNIDRLAATGMLFERAYSQQALCAPSRASVMTGRRPDVVKIYNEGVHFREALPDVVTLPQYFKQKGYHTRALGKVYHAHPPQPDPVSWSVPELLLDIPKRDEYLMPANRVRGFINPMEKGTATEAVDAPDDAYQDGQVARAAIEALQAAGDKPFFLAVGFKRPHLPFTAPKRYWDLYDRDRLPLAADTTLHRCSPQEYSLRYDWQHESGEMRNYTDIPAKGKISSEKAKELVHGYYACVSYIDAQVGRVLDELERLALTRRTVIILWSDHGFHLGEKGLWGKKDNTEMATRVPFIVSAPGHGQGLRTQALVELVDIYPTLVELCDLPVPGGLEGTSMVPLLNAPAKTWKKAAFSQYPRNNHSIMGYSVRLERFRYNEYRGRDGNVVDRELYDLSTDPYEVHNLVGKKPYAADLLSAQNTLHAGWKAAAP